MEAESEPIRTFVKELRDTVTYGDKIEKSILLREKDPHLPVVENPIQKDKPSSQVKTVTWCLSCSGLVAISRFSFEAEN